MQFIWEYQCNPNKWLEYDREINDFLNSANMSLDNKQITEYELEGWQMQFDFKTMRQRNMDSGFIRSIRCALLLPENGNKIIWCYQGERKRWISFTPKLSHLIEEHLKKCEHEGQNDWEFEAIMFGEDISVNLKDNLMVIAAEHKRPIKRLESTAGPPDTSDPPYPKSAPYRIRERNRELEEKDSKNNQKKKRIRKIKNVDNQEEEIKIKGDVKRRERKKTQITTEEESTDDDYVENENINKNGIRNEIEAFDHKETLRIKKKKLDEQLQIEQTRNVHAVPEADIECKELFNQVHVYMNPDGHFYDVMLNQTNIQQNNNKFYLMQLLESNARREYWVWFRWGRVGFKGQTNLAAFGEDLDGALEVFHKKFWDKTHNEFLASQNSFKKINGKYDLIRIDYTKKVVTSEEIITGNLKDGSTDESHNKNQNGGETMDIENCMDERVKKLMQTLCDLKTMETEACRLDYDFKKIPLGKITKEQIRVGNEALTRIEKHIKENNFDRDFTDAVNEYYTRIPHSFGMRTPPMIRTMDALKQEIELLDLLTGIEITVGEIAGDPLERHYSRLKWQLIPLEKDDQKYKIIEEYLLNTQGPTHDRYRLSLTNVFELCEKAQHVDKTLKFRKELDNRKLLWHGSRLTNWYGILAQGLRIAPPEAPSTGYMFGKGVYFSDIASKSANYSLNGPDCPGFMLLADVALGHYLDLRDSDDQMHLKLPSNKQSVRGVGRIVPKPGEIKLIDDGVEIPCGKPTELDDVGETSLIYNEYIVYNRDQIRERFLVEVAYQFDFEL